ncbi:MAG: phosphopantothenoylcysteine decarboxylase [Candidatus Omnitrophica bacterium]|nr:phosphopantothenoylcysteine decarboxylase [Candidatus Omnitrophota bacterium]MCM8799288.1 phosphopantothenoylcysteine decarboxylase [Candidatus Omnitrophota bacterium]
MSLKNKKILITAGPTWVPLDAVRLISNISTGKTGILIANYASEKDAKVTLFLGGTDKIRLNKNIRLINFKYFEELRDKLIRELKKKRYDFIIHSAAVSDFRPTKIIKGKIPSDRLYNLKLKPLPKIFKDIRKYAPKSKLITFKLECNLSDSHLIKKAKNSLKQHNSDWIVANRLSPYKAFIIDKDSVLESASSREELAKKLIKIISL